MINIGGITHPNHIIDGKAKIFYDYFHFFLSENEYLFLQNQPLDNHLTILQKIDFRLTNGKLERSSKILIIQWMESDLFNLKSDYFLRDKKRQSSIRKIKNDLNKKNIDEESLRLNVKEAVIHFNESHNYESTVYFETCVDSLISYLSCGCESSKHKNEIIYFTKLIAAEYRRLGFSFKELTGVNSILDKILSKEIRIDQSKNQIHSRFPLPENIESQRGTELFEHEVIEFLKNRTLKEQFYGLINYLKKDSKESVFIVKVKNALLIEESHCSYKNIEVISASELESMGAGLEGFQKDHFEKFLSDKNCIYIKVPLEYKVFNTAVDIAFKEAENTLSFLNYPSPMRGEIDKGNILQFHNNSLGWKWARKSLIISNDRKYDLDNLNLDLNIYDQLSNLDILFYKTFTSRTIEDKIINAWRYVEILGDFGKMRNNRECIKSIPYILLCNEESYQKSQLENLIANLIINNRGAVECKIPYGEMDFVLEKENYVEILKNNTNYYFTNQLIDNYENLDLALDDFFRLYKECFEVLYEQRNLIVHQAKICEMSAEQNIISMQIILRRIRKNILADVKTYSRKELTNSITYLIDKGKTFLIRTENEKY